MKAYKELSTAMLRTGVLGFGGGPSTIPLFRYEAVTRYRWMSDEEFGEVLAIANALPGPIATKLAAYLGYRLKGWFGAALGIITHIFPSSAAMVLLFSAISFFSTSSTIKGMIAAIVPVVTVMFAQMAYGFGEKAAKGLGKYAAVLFGIAAFLLLQTAKLHPAIVIAIALAYGSVHYKLSAKWQHHRTRKETR